MNFISFQLVVKAVIAIRAGDYLRSYKCVDYAAAGIHHDNFCAALSVFESDRLFADIYHEICAANRRAVYAAGQNLERVIFHEADDNVIAAAVLINIIHISFVVNRIVTCAAGYRVERVIISAVARQAYNVVASAAID